MITRLQEYTSVELLHELGKRFPLFFACGWKEPAIGEDASTETQPVKFVGPDMLIQAMVVRSLNQVLGGDDLEDSSH